MSTAPTFAATPRAASAVISTANANRDGTGTLVDVFVAGASGSRIERIKIKAIETTVASIVRLFLNDGVNIRLFDEIPVGVVAPSGTLPGFEALVPYNDPEQLLVLPTGWKLQAAPHDAKQFVVWAFGGDF